jgi:uncharacterized protein (TIGR02996 family)
MSEEDTLLKAIRDNPCEDAPVLAYADFLDREGGKSNIRLAEVMRVAVISGKWTRREGMIDPLP